MLMPFPNIALRAVLKAPSLRTGSNILEQILALIVPWLNVTGP